MKSRVSQLAMSVLLAVVFAAPALAQTSNWKLNSDRSISRLSLTSTADPDATIEAGIARVKGTVSLNPSSAANSSFDFTIYPANLNPAATSSGDTGYAVNAAEFSSAPRSAVFHFRSKEVSLTRDGNFAVKGDLTLSYIERPVLITYSEAYAGAVYGEPEVHSTTREVTFIFENASAAAIAGTRPNLKFAAFARIKTEDFPGLSEAVTGASWPVVVEDQNCQASATTGEDYHGASCTGTAVVTASRPSASQTIAEDYPGPDPAAPRARDSVRIALNLELTRDTSASATASGN
ncbi:MAG: YceI family protein [Candidatus Acidiferrales bacterium]